MPKIKLKEDAFIDGVYRFKGEEFNNPGPVPPFADQTGPDDEGAVSEADASASLAAANILLGGGDHV